MPDPKKTPSTKGYEKKKLTQEAYDKERKATGLKKISVPKGWERRKGSSSKTTMPKGNDSYSIGTAVSEKPKKIDKPLVSQKFQANSDGDKQRRDPITKKWLMDSGTVKTTNMGDKTTQIKGNLKRIDGIDEPDTKSAPKKTTTTSSGSMVRGGGSTSADSYLSDSFQAKGKTKRERSKQEKRIKKKSKEAKK